MRKVYFFCDKCFELQATQKVAYRFEIEQHLYPMGSQEWCIECVEMFQKGLTMTPDVHRVEYE